MKTKYINNVDNLDSTPFNVPGIGEIGGLIAGQFCKYKLPVVLLLKNKRQLMNYKDSELTLIYPHETFTCSPPAININNVQKDNNEKRRCLQSS